MLGAITYCSFFQLISAIISVFFLVKNKGEGLLRLLTLFLVVTFFVEYVGAYYLTIEKDSFYIYYYYTLFEYYILYFIYVKLIKNKKNINICSALLLFFTIIWLLVLHDKSFLNYSIILGGFMVGFLVFFYLNELLASNLVIDYKKMLSFWLSVGLLVFHLPSIPFFGLFSFMKGRSLFPILTSLIILMNIIISFGLIWSNKKEESY